MKIKLGTKMNGGGVIEVSQNEEKPRMNYPCLCIPITKDQKALLKKLNVDGLGEATIKFRVKRMVLGEDFGPDDQEGSVDLEIHSIDVDKTSQPDVEDNAEEAIRKFMNKD